ncbi:anti-sigma factor [Chelatococcus sp. SYSU_G07232]|uniref:Anti-sigma factor n=1 Tax=Chelatococcus albus TaxID=3047466 RepID=A0ABT7AJE7_9HYPH|nr:anti-sigma factor [Chelatococcus sp. SYSU_G07232]MDJ1159501.1 anti-sigma factor [Chelatococcus sp. SYSU_G07232]
MSERDDIERLAGEYVLGTLDLAERRAVAARRAREPALDNAIAAWERRLSPLGEAAPEVAPPEDLWAEIERALDAPAGAGAPVVDLTRHLRRWKLAAFASGAIAASLALFVAGERVLRPTEPQSFVAVLQKDAASPAFIVSVDLATRNLTVRAVSAERPADRSYELWLVNDRYDAPRSLGLVEDEGFTQTAALAAYPREVVQSSVLAVSLEPRGGSTTGRPSGPVLFTGRLVQATP